VSALSADVFALASVASFASFKSSIACECAHEGSVAGALPRDAPAGRCVVFGLRGGILLRE
jgi:hypothetical protein